MATSGASSRNVKRGAGPGANSPASCSAPRKSVTGTRLRRDAGRPRSRHPHVALYLSPIRPTGALGITGHVYPMETLQFERAFVPEAIGCEYVIFFEHDPQMAAAYIRERSGRVYVERADAAV